MSTITELDIYRTAFTELDLSRIALTRDIQMWEINNRMSFTRADEMWIDVSGCEKQLCHIETLSDDDIELVVDADEIPIYWDE